MGIVHEYLKVLPVIDALHTCWYTLYGFNTSTQYIERCTLRIAYSHCCERIVDIMLTKHIHLDCDLACGSNRHEACSTWCMGDVLRHNISFGCNPISEMLISSNFL